MKNALTGLLVALAMVALPANAADTAESFTLPGMSRWTPPAYLSKPTVMWPGDMNREALVRLLVTISKEGRVVDIELAEGGFHEKRFVDAAMTGVKDVRFRPATFDGQPVATTAILPIVYRLGQNGDMSKWATGISYEFRYELKKVEKLFAKKDYAGANFHADWMLREKVRYGYEFAVLKAELAQTHASVGHDLEALQAAADATERTSPLFRTPTLVQSIPPNSPSNYLLSKEIVVPLLELRMRAAVKLGLYPEALGAYYELAGLVEMSPDDPRAILGAQVTAKLQGNEPLAFRVSITSGASFQPLFRTRFRLDHLHGNIEVMDLYCSSMHRELQYAPGEEWVVPPDWNDCSVKIMAEPGTSFVLVELAN